MMYAAAYGRNTQAGIDRRIAAARELSPRPVLVIDNTPLEPEPNPPVDPGLAREELWNAVISRSKAAHPNGFKPTYADVERKACKVFNVSRIELKSPRRQRQLSAARHFVMYWTTRLTTLSLPTTGRLLGGRDHTTILHGKAAYVEKRAAQGRKLRPAR